MKLPNLYKNYPSLNHSGSIDLQADSGDKCDVSEQDITKCAQRMLPLYQQCIQGNSKMKCLGSLVWNYDALSACGPCFKNGSQALERALQKLANEQTPPKPKDDQKI